MSVFETEDEKVTFITLYRFEKQSQLDKSEQHILIGSYIYPEYYEKGDKFSDGREVKFDRILKFINLRYSDKIEEMHNSFENSIGYYDGEEYDNSSNDVTPSDYGYKSWDEMAFKEVFEGDIIAWNHYLWK